MNERQWTSVEGRSIEAELLGTDGRVVVLRAVPEERVHVFPIERLRDEDRERVLTGDALVLRRIDLDEKPAEALRAEAFAEAFFEHPDAYAAYLRNRLLAAYGSERDPRLEEWYFLYRWVDLFRVAPAHSNLRASEGRFGRGWSRGLVSSVLGDADFSREFFRQISPDDNMREVSAILRRIYERHPESFEEYKSLALSIAIVYDAPRPGNWPVAGVPSEISPPGLPDPVEAFDFFVRSRRSGRLAVDSRRLSARELRFVVDIIAPFDDLEWAQQRVRLSVGRFENAYSMIQYDHDRYSPGLRTLELDWPHSDYRLKTIRRLGGICADQAYFASQVGKARGLPTVYFIGTGERGRHAWIGFFQGRGRGWNLDVGRYEQDSYAIGYARDPQTWKRISDHEIAFEQERFRTTAAYRASRYHSDFARELALSGRQTQALRAARRAIDVESRNRDAWELVLEINHEKGSAGSYDAALRMAAEAFRHHPHVEAEYLGRLIESHLEREEFEEAFSLVQQIIRQNRRERPDISIVYAKRFLEVARDSGDAGRLVRNYRQMLSDLGNYAPGGIFFEEIARPFLVHLSANGEGTQARLLFSRTRNQFRPGRGTLLDRRMDDLGERLR